MSSSPLEPGGRFGDYELVRKLELGGMGEVWKASQIHSDQLVAMKFIKPSLLDDPANKTRFLNEAKTLGRLKHDRIVPLYTVCEEDGRLALVLPFIDGESLARRIDRLGALPLDLFMSCVRDVLPALGFAHQMGIVHRDVKPQNILIDQRERFFLSDFGIAVAEFVARVTGEQPVGTPYYMSPEQFEDSSALVAHRGGHRTDIYSFGVVMFEMLAGRLPFGDRRGNDSYASILAKHCTSRPPRLRDINPRVSPAVEQVVLKCLEKKPDDRPQSCADLLKMLEEAAAAPPGTPSYPDTVVDKDSASYRNTIDSRKLRVSPSANPKVTPPPITPVPSPKPQQKKPGPMVWIALGCLLIAVAVAGAILLKRQPAPIDYSKVKAGDPMLDNCKGVRECIDKKAQSDKLLAVRDWSRQPYNSRLFGDCMFLPACIDSAKRAQSLESTDWKSTPPPDNCMDYPPCLAAHVKVVQPPTPAPPKLRKLTTTYGETGDKPPIPDASKVNRQSDPSKKEDH